MSSHDIGACQPGLFNLLQQIVIQLDDKVAVLRAAAAREYQPIVVRGKSDDVELSHRRPRRAEPAVRALLGQSSSLWPMSWGILGCCLVKPSTTRGLMFQRRKKPGPTQESNRPLLRNIDNHRVIRLAIANERNDAPVARFRLAHDAVIAADRQGGHARIITGGCDGLPRQVRPRPTTASN